MCCGSVQHNYSSRRVDFLLKLQEKLGNVFERFDALDSLGKSSFILSSELWEEHFDSHTRRKGDQTTVVVERLESSTQTFMDRVDRTLLVIRKAVVEMASPPLPTLLRFSYIIRVLCNP